MKTIKFFLLVIVAITISSCSKSDNDSDSACNEIVCGGFHGGPTGYTIYRGTIDPDTCGSIELQVNETTFNYYKTKWDATSEGYCCWEGLK